ncbi:DUF4405 domain-containing protein [Robertkochia solimangrovi]|uniref:DUF4405 domain-containing protein n=1 Tax=Robertkochia solimangrovi TaxID=2213046 RepID=UPI00117DCE19|nr:DUF4405 domain-containing protein [Robertkochia solimangrovi]TRZ43985.1 hypothetical protein DMZ48_08515 [Robertkochia solimangrovi]
MNRRILGNILLFTLLVLLSSGIIMYFKPFDSRIAAIHTFFGIVFLMVIILHLKNNKKPLSDYVTGKRKKGIKKLQAPFVLLMMIILASGVFFDLPGLNSIYMFGNELRNRQTGITEENFGYQLIQLNNSKGNNNIAVELKKGSAFQYPLFAIWAEDSLGNYLETLYISRVIASSTYDFGINIDGEWEPAVKRRPEALPYWTHKRGIKASDGLFTPLENSADIDAVSGATPTGNFLIESRSNFELNNYRILLEVNQSYDWNEYYSKDRFPEDMIYSGSGQVGQPSLIYAADIFSEFKESTVHGLMKLIGHGHHSGKNGELYEDLSEITTAKQIIDRVIISIDRTNEN